MDYQAIVEQIIHGNIDDRTHELLKRKDVVRDLVDIDADYLGSASEDIRDDYETVLYAVKIDGYTIKNASNRLRDYYTIAFQAVKSNGIAIQFLSDRLRDDFNIAINAVTEYDAYQYVSERLKKNKFIILKALQHGDNILDELPQCIKDNHAFMRSIT